uniref:Uncharacterized protein n=1 Tax=Sipha flava TaxID=143950 RepID=A0A2S2Q353_9HEMI
MTKKKKTPKTATEGYPIYAYTYFTFTLLLWELYIFIIVCRPPSFRSIGFCGRVVVSTTTYTSFVVFTLPFSKTRRSAFGFTPRNNRSGRARAQVSNGQLK